MYYKVFSRNLIFYIGFMAIMFPMAAACGTLENGGMAPTETAIPTLQITPVDRYFEVVTDNVNSRQGPGLVYEAGDTFNKGDVVSISGVTASGEWYQLTEGEWIAADFVVPYDPSATQTSLPTNTPLPTSSPTAITSQSPPTAVPPTQPAPTLIPPASPTPTPCVNRNCEPLEPIRTITPTRCIQRNCG